MLTGSALRLTRIKGPTPTNRERAAPMQAAGVPSNPRGLHYFATRLANEATSITGTTPVATRRWELVRRTQDFEAWVIAWPAGGDIDLHDHGESVGAVVTVRGSLLETAVFEHPAGRVATTTRLVVPGSSLSFGPGHIHGIVNAGSMTAISVHFYAPRLTEMTRYSVSGSVLRAQESIRCDLGEAIL